MRAWLAPLVLGVLAIAVVAYVVVGSQTAKPTAAAPGEYVAGLKRSPGTFKESSIDVGAQLSTLGEPDVTIDVDVMRPVFLPTVITVKQGQVVRLRLHGKDNGLEDMPELQGALGLHEFSGHGFQIFGPYDVWITGIRKGVTKEVIFRASVAGEFQFECVVFCSPNHYAMLGKLVVEER